MRRKVVLPLGVFVSLLFGVLMGSFLSDLRLEVGVDFIVISVLILI